jgi:signal transduction histidine kinase
VRFSLTLAVHVLDDLLTYEKIQGGNLTLDRGSADIMPLLTMAVRPFKAQAHFAEISLLLNEDTLQSSPLMRRAIFINMDTVQISRVFANLLVNAIAYTPRGGRVDVSVTLIAEDTYVRIEVNDLYNSDMRMIFNI